MKTMPSFLAAPTKLPVSNSIVYVGILDLLQARRLFAILTKHSKWYENQVLIQGSCIHIGVRTTAYLASLLAVIVRWYPLPHGGASRLPLLSMW
jgi:hypothetical protein